MSHIKSELVNILACPSCKAKVDLQEGWLVCSDSSCRLKYPVRDGIPVMLLDEAQK